MVKHYPFMKSEPIPQSVVVHAKNKMIQPMFTSLVAGLYRVEQPRFVAGFVVQKNRVTDCAPILITDFRKWEKLAVRIGEFNAV